MQKVVAAALLLLLLDYYVLLDSVWIHRPELLRLLPPMCLRRKAIRLDWVLTVLVRRRWVLLNVRYWSLTVLRTSVERLGRLRLRDRLVQSILFGVAQSKPLGRVRTP